VECLNQVLVKFLFGRTKEERVRKYILGIALLATTAALAQHNGFKRHIDEVNFSYTGESQALKWFDIIQGAPAFRHKLSVKFNSVDASEQVEFLNDQFATDIFTKASLIKLADFVTYFPENSSAHAAIIETAFKQCSQLLSAYKKVRALNSQKFNLKVLNKFRSYKQDHSLMFIVSETPLQPEITQLFTWLDASNHDTPCMAQPVDANAGAK
jgi:hypothetical protein